MTISLTTTPPVLAPDYYLHNFRFLLDWVAERYQELLSPDEVGFLNCFRSLDSNSQCLLVRLMSRKGPWFRSDKLSYAEIDNLTAAADYLVGKKLLSCHVVMDITSLAGVLTKPELELLFSGHLVGQKSKRKEEWVELLVQEYPGEKSWDEWTMGRWGPLYQLEPVSLINTLCLLFFGNAHQDLSEFVLQDLGLVRYEQYEIDHRHRLFLSQDDIRQYQLFVSLAEAFELAEHRQQLIAVLEQIPVVFSNATMERRFARLANRIAYSLERSGDVDIALALYQRHRYPPAREREIRILERRGDYQQAWNLLAAVLERPYGEDEQQIAERMAPRLAKKAGVAYSANAVQLINEKYIELPRLMDDSGEFLYVEECARLFYDASDSPCFYVENQLLSGLFGLWLWPELFRSVEGAFANPFQMAPLDFYHEGFQERRPGIENLWNEMDTGEFITRLQKTYGEKRGIANPLVSWQYLDEDLLMLALTCIPAHHLRAIFQRMLFDLKRNTSGLPDLIQFLPQEKSYRLIEVKGPGDRIQDNQHRWMMYFQQHGIPAEVCYVAWSS